LSTAEQTKQPKRQIGQNNNSNKKQMPKRQRQERAQKNILWIFGGAIGIAIIALLLALVFNWYIPDVRPLNKVFLKIDDREYNMRYFMDALYGYSGGAYSYIYIDYMLDLITSNYFFVEYAKQNGAKITDKDISDYIKERGFRNNQATRDLVAAILASQYMQDEVFKPAIGNSADQYQIMAILAESADAVAKIINELADGIAWENLSTNSLNTYSKDNRAKIPWNPLEVITAASNLNSELLNSVVASAAIGDIVSIYDADTTKNLGFWIVKVTAEGSNPGGINATRQISVILVSSQKEADEVRAKLEDGGDFAELAKEYSQHKDSKDDGGDLGQVSKFALPVAVGNYVFGTEPVGDIEGINPAPIGQVSEALRDTNITTTGGYWVYQVVDFGANLSLTAEQITAWVNVKYSALKTRLDEENESRVVNTFTDDLKQYARDHA